MSRDVAFGLEPVVVVGAIAIVFGRGTSAAAQTRLTPLDLDVVSLGQSIHSKNCSSCHGVHLEGQPNWRSPGPDGQLPAPPHDATGHALHHDGDMLLRLTKYATGALISDPTYESNMPFYGRILTNE